MLTASSTAWQLGLLLGIVVIAVAAAIVITIVLLARKIAEQAKTAEQAVEVVRQQTDRAGRDRSDQRLRRPDPACGQGAPEGGGRKMIVAMTSHDYWWTALVIGLVAALVVAGLLALLIQYVVSIDKSVGNLLEIAGKVGANTANIPQLTATAPVLALIVDEAVIQDGYMNALTDGYGGAAA